MTEIVFGVPRSRRGRPPKRLPVLPPPVELDLGQRRVVHVQRLGSSVHLTSGTRVDRAATPAVMTAGVVLLPLKVWDKLDRTVRRLRRQKPPA